jgi:hypothetical protein
MRKSRVLWLEEKSREKTRIPASYGVRSSGVKAWRQRAASVGGVKGKRAQLTRASDVREGVP